MWCPTCQKNMPTRASQVEAGAVDCMHCGQTLKRVRPANVPSPSLSIQAEPPAGVAAEQITSRSIAPEPVADVPAAPSKPRRTATPPNPQWNLSPEWEVSDQVQALRRKLNLLKEVGSYAGALEESQAGAREQFNQRPQAAFSAPHLRFDPPSTPATTATREARSRSFEQETPVAAATNTFQLGWTVLSFGLTASVCGGVLLGWSNLTERADLWQLGLPATIVGLASLLLGLLMQLDSLRKQIAERPVPRMPPEPVSPDQSFSSQTYTIHEAHPTQPQRPSAATLGAHFSRRSIRQP